MTRRIPKPRFNLECPTSECYVYLIFRYPEGRLKMSTTVKVDPKTWNKAKQRINPTTAIHVEDNAFLGRIEDAVLTHFLKDRTQDVKTLKRAVAVSVGLIDPEEVRKPTLFEFIKSYNDKRRPNLSSNTAEVIDNSEKQLRTFCAWRGRMFDYQDVGVELLEDIKTYFYTVQQIKTQTLALHIRYLKHWMKEAHAEGLHNNLRYRSNAFKVKKIKTSVLALYIEDLEKLAALDTFPTPTYEHVRDLFLVGCFTVQRFSDFSRIKPGQVKNVQGQDMISVYSQKTGKYVSIPLHPILRSVLEKYDYQLPTMHRNTFNDYIKDVCKDAGLTDLIHWRSEKEGRQVETFEPKYKHVSSHTARRTGVTLLKLNGVPDYIILSLTSHSSLSELEKYFIQGDRATAKHMAKVYASLSPLKKAL